MDFRRAFVIALEIIAADFIFGIILIYVAYYVRNLAATVVLSLIFVPLMTSIAVFFILEEAEDMIREDMISFRSERTYDKHVSEEKIAAAKPALASVMADVDEAKFEPMIKALIQEYREKGYLHPELYLESRINERLASGKTKEQAIEELYKKISPA